jgi:Animal haem peroxidase
MSMSSVRTKLQLIVALTALIYPLSSSLPGASAQEEVLGIEQHDEFRRSRQTDFGRMFPRLPPFQPNENLLATLAEQMRDPASGAPEGDNPNGFGAGVTFLGQFLDHDMTLMVEPLGAADRRLFGLLNNRTARLDLDSVYGGGLQGSPQLYDRHGRFLFSTPNGFEDFQRDPTTGVAVLVENRNDENLIIAQIHIAFQKFHNHYINQGLSFRAAQQQVRWHWQWILVNEYLPTIVGQDVVNRFLTRDRQGRPRVRFEFYQPGNSNRPMMPIEFAVAAFRFGHSQVRNFYAVGEDGAAIFNAAGNDLRGSRPIPPELEIDFTNFFQIPGGPAPANLFRKTDSLLSANLFLLPVGPVIAPADTPIIQSLALRNLLRGSRLGLPSYQDVATAMGIAPLPNDQLGLSDPAWGGKAPLWYGILKESEVLNNGAKLGPTGGRIVAEVILGLIDADDDSYFNARRPWVPKDGSTPGTFFMHDLLRLANAL